MGYADHVGNNKRRSTKRSARLEARRAARKEVVYDDLNPETLAQLVWSAICAGGAVRLGATRDRGAWAVGFYGLSDEPFTEYAGQGELEELLVWGIEAFTMALTEGKEAE